MPPPVDPENDLQSNLTPCEERFSDTKIFPIIQALKQDITENIDSPLSWEQLTASDVNFAIIKPIEQKYSALRNFAIIYSCLVVRRHFQERSSNQEVAYSDINDSRAMLCELLAIRFLQPFANDRIQLAAALTQSWNPLAGAPAQAVRDIRRLVSSKDLDELNQSNSALEMAILTNSKIFVSAPLTQIVIDDIWSGRIVFTSASNRNPVADDYNQKQIAYYDMRKAPFLNYYRLRVPKYSSILEMIRFALLLVFFILCLAERDLHAVTIWEGLFMLFFASYVLSEYTAAVGHGWRFYMADMWNAFDTAFALIGLVYVLSRIKGLISHDDWYNGFAFDLLACGGCILFPRIAFFAVTNNVVVLPLRGMIADFIFFMGLAVICFSGILYTLWELAHLNEGNQWTVGSIAWFMTQVWFGNTSLTFQQAKTFHPVFGPIIMLMFAVLASALLSSMLNGILTNTFGEIRKNARQEHLFQFTLSIIEEDVKSGPLDTYQPPFNLLAYLILTPLSWFVSPQTLRTVNIFFIRVTSFPILITIAIYERYVTSDPNSQKSSVNSGLPRKVKDVVAFKALMSSKVDDFYKALFEVDVSGTDLAAATEGNEEHDFIRSLSDQDATASLPASHKALLAPSTPPQRARPSPPTGQRHTMMMPGFKEEQVLPSPLAQFYLRRPVSMPDVERASESQDHTFQDILANVKSTTERMKALEERQARIESLLLTLTQSSLGETSTGDVPQSVTDTSLL